MIAATHTKVSSLRRTVERERGDPRVAAGDSEEDRRMVDASESVLDPR
jgi:hypothetical protein